MYSKIIWAVKTGGVLSWNLNQSSVLHDTTLLVEDNWHLVASWTDSNHHSTSKTAVVSQQHIYETGSKFATPPWWLSCTSRYPLSLSSQCNFSLKRTSWKRSIIFKMNEREAGQSYGSEVIYYYIKDQSQQCYSLWSGYMKGDEIVVNYFCIPFLLGCNDVLILERNDVFFWYWNEQIAQLYFHSGFVPTFR